jgi:hypothetical protein
MERGLINVELEMIWKEVGVGLIEVLFQQLSGRTEENHRKVSQGSWCPGQNLHLPPLEHITTGANLLGII